MKKAMTERGGTDIGSLAGAAVIEIVASIGQRSFGLGYAALNLAASLERSGVNVFLASIDEKNDAYEACEEACFTRGRYIHGAMVGPAGIRWSPLLIQRLARIPNNSRVLIHLHGTWTYASFVAGSLRRRWGCPLVQSPHGSLEPYAMKTSPIKKAIASLIYERRNLMTASCIWALSEQEKTSVRAYGYKGRVSVIPNGVQRAMTCTEQQVVEFRAKHGVSHNERVMLFLGRITRKKNLPLLLKSFAKNRKARPEWVLLIAGSDEGGHIHEINSLVQELGIGNSVRMVGQITGHEKACAFASASLFVLPSKSEGLPIAVLEAMEYARAILVTDGWMMPVESSAKYGWRVPVEESEFDAALIEAMSASEEVLAVMGLAGRTLVRDKLGWDTIAKQACSLYESLLI